MAGENYNNTFGGENVNPANLSYIFYEIDGPLALTWAFEAPGNTNVTADKIDIACSVLNSPVAMPPADQVTVGQDILFSSVGEQAFAVTDHGGNPICVVESGTEWFVYLTDNSTKNGIWRSVQFGASVSAANAAALAGAGLRANVTKLDQNLPTTQLLASYAIQDSDRATVVQNNGGSVTYTFPDPASLGNGWFVYVINPGTGNVTLTPPPPNLIDGAPTKVIAPGDSLIVLSDSASYHSMGYGRAISNSVTGVSINAAGTGNLILTGPQVAAQVQDYIGLLTGNRTIEYGPPVGYWFVYNHTTGSTTGPPPVPYTLTMKVNALDVPGATVPQGSFSIIRSNGTNMSVAYSDAGGTVTSVATTTNLTGGPITTTGTLDLSSTGVVAGIYGALGPPIKTPVLTVDVKGRITAAGSVTLGSGASGVVGTAPGNIPILDAGGNLPSLNGGMQPGDIQFSIALTKPGFVFANGTTIGSAASGSSQRANADTVNLFKLIWTLPAAQFPIYLSNGAASTRGASSTADFSANKRIKLPDLRGRVAAGLDNAGGIAAAGMMTGFTIMGMTGGLQTSATGSITSSGTNRINFGNVALAGGTTVANSASSTSIVQGAGSGVTVANPGGTQQVTGYTPIDANHGISVSGASGNFNIVQPTMTMNPFIKL